MIASHPNLFDFATSELTQDAVLCWLLSWADHRCAKQNAGLHQIGQALVAALLHTHGLPTPDEPYTVAAKRQLDKVDVVARIGDRYLLAIEDKTDTGPHSNQLVRYRESMEQLADREGRRAVLVYLKTGERHEGAHVRSKGWQILGRQQLLEILSSAISSGIQSDILLDFHRHLSRIEAEATAYKRIPIAEKWPAPRAWEGLFAELESRLSREHHLGWGYVANPKGGFTGLWWGFRVIDGGKLYAQLEEQKLTVKVHVPKRDKRRALRTHWSQRVIAAGPSIGAALRRPSHFGFGKYMTVACTDDWRVPGEDGLLDLEATVRQLNKVEQMLGIIGTRGEHED